MLQITWRELDFHAAVLPPKDKIVLNAVFRYNFIYVLLRQKHINFTHALIKFENIENFLIAHNKLYLFCGLQKELVSEDFKPVKASEIEELASMTLNGSEDDDAPLYTEEELEQELAMLKTFETTILREIQTPSTPPTSAPEQDTK